MEKLFRILNELSIDYIRIDHQAVFSAQEVLDTDLRVPGADTKNLVLTDSKNYYLLVVPLFKRVNLKLMANELGVKKLSFASPDILMTTLAVEPGSVSMLGLFNDRNLDLNLLIDQEIWEQDAWAAHPLVNTSTLVINKKDFQKFFNYTGHSPKIVNVEQG